MSYILCIICFQFHGHISWQVEKIEPQVKDACTNKQWNHAELSLPLSLSLTRTHTNASTHKWDWNKENHANNCNIYYFCIYTTPFLYSEQKNDFSKNIWQLTLSGITSNKPHFQLRLMPVNCNLSDLLFCEHMH